MHTFEISISSQSDYVHIYIKKLLWFVLWFYKVEFGLWFAYFKSSLVCFCFSSAGTPVIIPPFPPEMLRPVSEPLPQAQAQVACIWQVCSSILWLPGKHSSPDLSGIPSFSFWDISGSSPSRGKSRWDGWRQFCRQCCEMGFLSGLSSWRQSSQKAFILSPVLSPQELQMASPSTWSLCSLPGWNKLQAVETLLSFYSAIRNPVSFCLERQNKERTQDRKSQKVGKLMFKVWNFLRPASCSNGASGDIYNPASCGHINTTWKWSRSLLERCG